MAGSATAAPLRDDLEPAAHSESAAQRFAADIVRMHERLSFSGLADAVAGPPLHTHDSGDGVHTIAVHEAQLPRRYLLGVYGFRLAQYLRLGWVCPRIAHKNALFHEPRRPEHPVPDVHVLTIEQATGRIRGYAALAASLDPRPLPLDAPDRSLLAVESDHQVRLLDRYAAAGWTTHHAYEAKRLLRDQAMPRGDLAARVPWHVLTAWGRCLHLLGGPARRVLAVGDGKERGSLRHLRLMGFDLDVTHGTDPGLPETDLLWPIFAGPGPQAEPFVGRLPETFASHLDLIDDWLTQPLGTAPIGNLLDRLAAHSAAIQQDATQQDATQQDRTRPDDESDGR